MEWEIYELERIEGGLGYWFYSEGPRGRIAVAAMYFLRDHPNSIIIIRPSSIARARLYQMMMSSIWNNIEWQYEIMGKYGNDWIPFRKGLNYSDFIV